MNLRWTRLGIRAWNYRLGSEQPSFSTLAGVRQRTTTVNNLVLHSPSRSTRQLLSSAKSVTQLRHHLIGRHQRLLSTAEGHQHTMWSNIENVSLKSLQETVSQQNQTRVHDVADRPQEGDKRVDLKYNESENRFELWYYDDPDSSPSLVSFMEFKFESAADKRVMDMNHTWADPAFRGMKLPEIIVALAMEYANVMGFKIIPTCSYVSGSFLSKHPEWRELVQSA
eukprot:gb/GECG01005074.1/.p1 GENE.gb/GECG01005074.1/~~gb/GECG01005074.1/.p1  ORF type:complete len:225 (+),score=20.51 gb/GECG01005074.1/:1-675(+)